MKTCQNCDKRRMRKDGIYICIEYHFCEHVSPSKGTHCDKWVALTPETEGSNACDPLALFSFRPRKIKCAM